MLKNTNFSPEYECASGDGLSNPEGRRLEWTRDRSCALGRRSLQSIPETADLQKTSTAGVKSNRRIDAQFVSDGLSRGQSGTASRGGG